MCEVKPGPRCASDTCLAAAEAAQSYSDSYPGGPDINSLVGSESIGMLHARIQVANRRWHNAHEALGAELASPNPDPERVETLKAEARRHLTDYQVSQEVLHGTWAKQDTRDAQDEVITNHIEASKPVEQYDDEGYSLTTGIHRERGLDRDGYTQSGFRTTLEADKDGNPTTVTCHRDTGTAFGPDGYDRAGVNAKGINRRGFDVRTGTHTGTGRRFDESGYDVDGFDRRGWDELSYNKHTGALYDRNGYTKAGEKVHESVRDEFETELAAVGA